MILLGLVFFSEVVILRKVILFPLVLFHKLKGHGLIACEIALLTSFHPDHLSCQKEQCFGKS